MYDLSMCVCMCVYGYLGVCVCVCGHIDFFPFRDDALYMHGKTSTPPTTLHIMKLTECAHLSLAQT